ncbi:hypothetical protein CDD81_4183 [Ophiocordyceps australis]|uniref:GPI inositol-deacylase n=1 Tax=Ophiocordyceps australis TaxID=1399860 RepID=A0A2C5XR04_9HYPO|nr:hypothetical protein CDD81_4183 [Ophiocordyceps australis]
MTSCSSPSADYEDVSLSYRPDIPDARKLVPSNEIIEDQVGSQSRSDSHSSSLNKSDITDIDSSVRLKSGLSSSSSTRRSSRQTNLDWKRSNGHHGPGQAAAKAALAANRATTSPWFMSRLALVAASVGVAILLAILSSLASHHVEPKGCRMSYMRPSYLHFADFDTEHIRFASKYSLYLYREQGIDDGEKLRGIPVLFIPGNAGSYKQVRPIAAEAANYFEHQLRHDGISVASGVRNLDFFTVDFNEDITAFHGQTLLDQAEYLNEAVRFILSLYSDPQRTDRDSQLPDPSSVVVLGHSMGGIVARAMLTQQNYQPKSINTIITMSAPHARPPVTFDGQIVQIYDGINDYWRRAYMQRWANDNPLWHVTLVSIAGGSLDTVVPSDYASLESIVPETHGFTVFTTGIPTVWTSMDHQAILWCDQFRKVVARALHDIVDVHRASQTKPRADRMRLLRRRLLPGTEAAADGIPLSQHSTILLTLGGDSSRIVPAGARLRLPSSESVSESKPMAYLLPVPPHDSPGARHFTLITNGHLGQTLQVLLCSVSASQNGSPTSDFMAHIDLSGGSSTPARLACKDAAPDSVLVPASTPGTRYPFQVDDGGGSFTYLQYGPEHLTEHEFIAIVDKEGEAQDGFVVAEFSDHDALAKKYETGLAELLCLGLSISLPAERPMMMEISVPAVQSALLALKLELEEASCRGSSQLFTPLMRQYLDKPYESKFFVNATGEASISLHGVAPYMPPALEPRPSAGIAFQLWSDPTCHTAMHLRLSVDVWGSMGKLYMRYRTALAAFPLLVVTMVLHKQFRVYDETGIFIPFSAGLDLSLRLSTPLLLLALTLLSVLLGRSPLLARFLGWSWRESSVLASFRRNELLIGSDDMLYCLLVPFIGIVCIGVCAVVHYAMLTLTQLLGLLFGLAGTSKASLDAHRGTAASPPFVEPTSKPRRRIISAAILLFLVSTFIPYQFAYLVACLVQLFATARAFHASTLAPSTCSLNYYNYAHSILLLMTWVLPINLPILAVWVRNLAVHWMTPFSSHHNLLSIMPFILLVENITTGRMVPQMTASSRHVTSILLFGTALCAAIYGVSRAYILHHLVNIVAAWLVLLHSASDTWYLASLAVGMGRTATPARKNAKAR